MRIAVTGTPGVGKTTVARRLADQLGVEYVDVTQVVREGASEGHDEERDVPVADVGALDDSLPEDGVLDGHIAHRLDVDYAVVLRCEPSALRERLKQRGWDRDKVRENVEAEALDVVLAEALAEEIPVFEWDTTEPTPEETAERVAEAFEEREERNGVVDWSAHIGGVR